MTDTAPCYKKAPGQDQFEMVAYGVFDGRFYGLGFASLRLAQPRQSDIGLSESIINNNT